MKTTPPTIRTTDRLSKTAAAGGAVAAGMFALQHQAEAAVVYSGVQNVTATIGTMGPFGAFKQFDVDNDAFNDFTINVRRYPAHPAAPLSATAGMGQLNATSIYNYFARNASNDLRKFANGVNITAGLFNSNIGVGDLYKFSSINPTPAGTWLNGQSAFAALKLVRGANTHYGWVRLRWADDGDAGPEPNSITAIDWAYNNTPGASLLTGEGAAAIPEPSRALLALAGLGGVALRRRRKAVA